MKPGHLLGGNARFQPHGQEPAYISNGMESAIETSDLVDRVVYGRGDFEQAEIFMIDKSAGQKLACDEGVPVVPIVAAWSLEAHDRLRIALASLGEGQNFKAFIMCPEAAGKQGNGVGFFLKDEFTGKEVFERDKFGVIGNCGIRTLLEGQHNIDPEAVFAPGALLACAHDPIGAPGNDHEPFLDDPTGKLEGHLVVWIIRSRASRTEDADLAPTAIAMKDAESMTQFFDGAVDDLEIQDVQMRVVESKRPGQEFFHDRGLQVVFRAIEQEANLAE